MIGLRDPDTLAPRGVGTSMTAGWVWKSSVPSPEELRDFLREHSVTIGGGAFVGGNFVWSPGSGYDSNSVSPHLVRLSLGSTIWKGGPIGRLVSVNSMTILVASAAINRYSRSDWPSASADMGYALSN